MRKNFLLTILLLALLAAPTASLATSVAAAATAPPADWAWLVAQVESGAETITLPCDISCENDEVLLPKGKLTIIGNGHTLADITLGSGTVIFQNVRLVGFDGLAGESGGPGLTLQGDGTIAVFTEGTRATGGRSGTEGEFGGDGVLMEGNGQGLLLSGKVSARGGIGKFYGGAGVRVLGCNGNVMAAGDTNLMGDLGLGIGGAGLNAPACCKITLSDRAKASAGRSSYDGGHGVFSHACDVCDFHAAVSIGGESMLFGGAAKVGGSALYIERGETKQAIPDFDLTIQGQPSFFGAAGDTSGAAITAIGCRIQYDGEPSFTSGAYCTEASSVIALTDCEEAGAMDARVLLEGAQLDLETDPHPASDMALIINSALSQQNNRFVPETVENGLNTRDLQTKFGGLTVERGRVTQAKVNDGGLKISVYDGQRLSRLEFNQYLMSDGAEGVRLVLVATSTQEWLIVESTLAALKKLTSLGVTQLAYTNKEPVYHERIIDIATVVDAAEKYEKPVSNVIFGTADDCVIFVPEDGTWIYQEDLMPLVLVPLEDPVES